MVKKSIVKKQTQDYDKSLSSIVEKIEESKHKAITTVNELLIELYWFIGETIVNLQEKGKWGDGVVEQLSGDLRMKYPNMSGFSSRNLWDCKRFYLTYHDFPKLRPLVAEIAWSHNLVILHRCGNDLEREFYLRMTRKFGWTKNVLIHQIENQAYEKTLLSKNSFAETLPESVGRQAKLAVKDEYLFDFLDLGERHDERQLQNALLLRMEAFLREMGGLFTFAGSQYRLDVGGKEYFVDILLYHRRLKCLVALELKVGEFKPEYVGKMQFYLAVLDDLVKTEHENPSIGMILCRDRNRTVVEYALKSTAGPMGVAQYRMVKKLPSDLESLLPSAEQVGLLMDGVD